MKAASLKKYPMRPVRVNPELDKIDIATAFREKNELAKAFLKKHPVVRKAKTR